MKSPGNPTLFSRGPKALAALAAVLAGLTLLFFLRPVGDSLKGEIPLESLSQIHREKARAQKDFSAFIGTPAGKIWEKHPYWDPETCRKIAAGEVEPGMSREQALAALGEVREVHSEKRGETTREEWAVLGKGRWVLEFEGNVLKTAGKK